MKNQPTTEKLFRKYSYLSKKYAAKIYNYHELSYEYEDLVQEFQIKIFTSIKSYGKRWGKYRKGLAAKPVPLKYYLNCACSNKAKDFIKYINKENFKVRIDEIDLDFGMSDFTSIIPENNKFIINDVDLLEGLEGIDKVIFTLYLKGYQKSFLAKVINNNDGIKTSQEKISKIITKQKDLLITKHKNELLQTNSVFTTKSFEE